MKNIISKKVNRIALISIAAAALMVCSPLTVFAANSSASDTKTKVIYTGDGTTKSVEVANATNLDTFKNLMPGGTTNPQEIVIQNKSSQRMKVYFLAEPSANKEAEELLKALQLEVTFKMDDSSAVQTLYKGSASGKNGTTKVSDIVTSPILLGYVYKNSESGVISATLTAPETMGNEFQNASANIKWVMQFELMDPEIITSNSVPLVSPPSDEPHKPVIIQDNPIPLSPVTGDTINFTYVWILAGVVVLSGSAVVVIGIYNKKHRNRQK